MTPQGIETPSERMSRMTDQKLSAHIFCPFFGNLNPHSVSCEFLGRKLGIAVRFRSHTQKNHTLIRWCFSGQGHRTCPIAGANYRFYEKVQSAKYKVNS